MDWGCLILQELGEVGPLITQGLFCVFAETAASMDEKPGKDQKLPTTLHKDARAKVFIRCKELKALRGKLVTPG